MEHEVNVPFPVEDVRQALDDPQRLRRCVPGLQVDLVGPGELGQGEAQDNDTGMVGAMVDRVAGRLRLRVGSSTITYRGVLRVTGRAGQYRVEAEGREARGKGSVKATLLVTPQPADAGTNLRMSGTVQAKGRLVQVDPKTVALAARRLLDRFAAELSAELSDHSSGAVPEQRSNDISGVTAESAAEGAVPGPQSQGMTEHGPCQPSATGKPAAGADLDGGPQMDGSDSAYGTGGDQPEELAESARGGQQQPADGPQAQGELAGQPTTAMDEDGTRDDVGSSKAADQAGRVDQFDRAGSVEPADARPRDGALGPADAAQRANDAGQRTTEVIESGSTRPAASKSPADAAGIGPASGEPEDARPLDDLADGIERHDPDIESRGLSEAGGDQGDASLMETHVVDGGGGETSGPGDATTPGEPSASDTSPEDRDAGPGPAGSHDTEPPDGLGSDNERSEGPDGPAAMRRTMIGRSAEEVDHAPPRGRYAPIPAPGSYHASDVLRWIAPAAAALIASAVVARRVLRRRR